jgi:uncharacterized damage-inducible protein DinB
MVEELQDPRRTEPSFVLDERAMLEGWLEFHRVTLMMKCEGLSDVERKSRPIATSTLSLHGLLRHMAEVERSWFRRALLSDSDAPYFWINATTDAMVDDSEIFPLDDANWEDDLATWYGACDASREAAKDKNLDFTGSRGGNPVSLRWIYSHMIEEYARHNGHADIIRELVDGSVGA